MSTIAVHLNDGKIIDVEPIQFLPSGNLAIHPRVDGGFLSDDYFTLTHVPSGWRVISSRPGESLKEFVSDCKELDKLDWSFVSPCQCPSETWNASHALLDGRRCKPGYGDDFIRVCFSEPMRAVPAPEAAAGESENSK